jgi:membrane protein
VNIDILLIFDYVLQFGGTALLFAVIFKVLPDAKIKWKDVSMGSLATAAFFLVGKFVMGYFLSKSTTITTYGAAGSVILILLWVYYSSVILYVGAEFTQSYAQHFGSRIQPNRYAQWIKQSLNKAETSR